YGRSVPQEGDQALLIDGAVEMMRCMAPIAEALARMPASPSRPGVNAGMTFAMLRNLAPAIEGPWEWPSLGARLNELADAAAKIASGLSALGFIEGRLRALGQELMLRRSPAVQPGEATAPAKGDLMSATHNAPLASVSEDGIETVRGKDLTIKFNSKRC